ncbi:MerR family transcriptional regulator [Nocardia sp. 2YAB30]|uniref:MerR family transcriptional regulator n=1 Tax=unclassified Nocardia TaxID=2637762 RepID=UPI003F97F51B
MTDNTQDDGSVSIGELSRLTGVPVRTIRFYCDETILESRRTSGGHRIFDPATAIDRLLLVRRLRALGLSLAPIMDVLAGTMSLAEAVAAERRTLDTELAVLTWRRASLRAVEDAPSAERAARLELLAAVQDRHSAHNSLVAFWRRMLTPIPPEMFDGFIAMNVPDLPHDPAPHQVVAYAELATLIADPVLRAMVSRQLWRSEQTRIRHKRALLTGIAQACESAGHLLLANQQPRPGPELDQFVDAHAAARGERDTPQFRRQLLAGADDTDHRIHRYWSLTSELIGAPTVGAAHHWLYNALTQSASPDRLRTDIITTTEPPRMHRA